MNITSVNAASSTGTGSTSNKSSNLQTIGTKGQVVDGLISKVSDKISINFNGKEVSVSKSAVQDAKEGEIRKFEIMDVSEKSIVLKEVGNSIKNTESTGIICTTIEINQATFTEHLSKSEEDQGDEDDTEEALEDISKRLTSMDYASLIKEGFSLEAYELMRLDRALERVKDQRAFQEGSLVIQVEKQEEYRAQIKKMAVGNVADSGISKKIAEKLFDANLPITNENIVKIANATELASVVNPISDKAMSYLIRNELEPTIENLYHGHYSGSVVNVEEVSAAWEEIKDQAKVVLTKAGMEVTEDNLGKAKWLFQNQLPITEDTLNTLSQLQKMKQEIDVESILDKIVGAVSKGKAPEQASLGEDYAILAKQAVKDFAQIPDSAIVKVMNNQQKINLDNLKVHMMAEVSESTQAEIHIPLMETANIDIQAITAKRQIEEIRLKMTVEAGQKLVGKGIDLNTSDLQHIVEGLRELEDQYYQNLLKEGNLTQTAENISLLRETTEKVNELKTVPSYVLGVTLEHKAIQTVEDLSNQGSILKVQMDKAGAAYETLMTSPRKDMGDSIEKAFKNVDNILKSLNIEETQANQRAVRILGYNGMEINEASIMDVKAYDSKVNYLMENLHPAVTVEMIRNGVNPLNIPIDRLNQQITKVKEELGITQEERYSQYLWKLEKENGITEEERKSYIGIYRLLNNVEKTNGAAVGSVAKAGQDMTLQNLLTAVRTRKGNGINQAVDDEFGGLQSLTFQKESITEQVQAAYSSTNMEDYFNNMIKGLSNDISPEKLMNLENNNMDSIMNQSLESLSESMGGQELSPEDMAYYEEKAYALRELAKNSEDSIEFLNSYKIPTTANAIMAVKNVLENGTSLFQSIRDKAKKFSEEDKAELEDAFNGLSEGLENADSMQAAYEKAEKSMKNILSQEYGGSMLTTKDLAQLKLLSNGMELAKNLSKRECYEIPIIAGDSVTQINLTIVSGEKETGKVQISLQSQQLGKVQAEFNVKAQSTKGLILCESREELDMITRNLESFEEKLKTLGVDVKHISSGINSSIQTVFNKTENANLEHEQDADTKTLYQVAKAFVQYIKDVEQTNKY